MPRKTILGTFALALLTGVGLILGVTPTVSTAQFVDTTASTGNVVTSGTLAPPTGVSATSGDTITLTWTASTSTQTVGYRIYRSATSGTLGPLVATVAGRTTVTWTDANPPEGKNYYVVKSYYQNWNSGTVESVGTRPYLVIDTFSGTAGAPLGNSETGNRPWSTFNGTWTRNGSGQATTGAAATSNPMIYTDMEDPDVDARTDIAAGSGEAIYFRVVDGDDWMRARYHRQQTTGSTTEYEHITYSTETQYNDNRTQSQYNDIRVETLYNDNRTQNQYNDNRTQSQYNDIRVETLYNDNRTQNQYNDNRTQPQYNDYRTEYQWTTYSTEYLYNDMRREYEYYYPQWEVADVEQVATYHFISYTYTWSGWYDYEGPICQTNAPSVPSNTANTMYQVRSGTTCNNGTQTRWFKQRNDRTTNSNLRQSSCNCPLAGETLNKTTYSNQVVGYYWIGNAMGSRPIVYSPDYETGATRNVYGWDTNNNFGGTDNRVATGATRMTYYGQYWATSARDGDDTYANQSRSVATGSYWSLSACSCPTRNTWYGTYYAWAPNDGGDTATGASRLWSYTTYWAWGPADGDDTTTGTTRLATYTTYWALGPRDGDDTATASTRNADYGDYWAWAPADGNDTTTGVTRLWSYTTYYDWAARDGDDTTTGVTRLWSYTTYWALSPRDGDDTATASTRNADYGDYWAWAPADGNDTTTGVTRLWSYTTYWAFSPRDGDDTSTGTTRQTATGSTWNTTYCAGCTTRQVPYDYSTYALVLSKSVAGVVTDLATYSLGTATLTGFRVTVQGTTINVYGDAALLGTTTDATHQTATRHGVGLGVGTGSHLPGSTLTYVYLKAL